MFTLPFSFVAVVAQKISTIARDVQNLSSKTPSEEYYYYNVLGEYHVMGSLHACAGLHPQFFRLLHQDSCLEAKPNRQTRVLSSVSPPSTPEPLPLDNPRD